MRVPIRSLLVAAVVTVVAVGAGLLTLGTDHQDKPAAKPAQAQFTTTALAGYDTAGTVVQRGGFCDRVDTRQISAALGAAPTRGASWQNGDPVDVGKGEQDVGHEFGCRWTAADGTVAQAWVFAPPVGADEAQQLVRSAAKGPGCHATGGPPFGTPTLALTCTKDGAVEASYRGLFGDAWLVCEVSRPAGATWDVGDRAGRWCVGVLQADTTAS